MGRKISQTSVLSAGEIYDALIPRAGEEMILKGYETLHLFTYFHIIQPCFLGLT